MYTFTKRKKVTQTKATQSMVLMFHPQKHHIFFEMNLMKINTHYGNPYNNTVLR